MNHPGYLSIKNFTYHLPEEKIAKYPLECRDESKLLIYKNGSIVEDIYNNLDTHLPADSLLVFNNTKVVAARLLFEKTTGTRIEIFCLEPAEQYADITTALAQKGKVMWKCLIGGVKKWKTGLIEKKIVLENKTIVLRAERKENLLNSFLIAFSWEPADISFAEMLTYTGLIPLPPYLNRQAEEKDKDNYQTIYALHDGSVAAPTAGLHFTERLFEKLDKKNIAKDFVTLHVGAGTFMPVKAATMSEHIMHSEFIEINKDLIENLYTRLHNPIIATGTTSLRTLESIYWMGVKTILNPHCKQSELFLKQWDPYQFPIQNISTKDSLESLEHWMTQNRTDQIISKTQIIIASGYRLRLANALITNFHQPHSTLLLLVAAIAGEEWKKIYTYALTNNFRFLSYGDGCLIWDK